LYLDLFDDLELIKDERLKYFDSDNVDSIFLLRKRPKQSICGMASEDLDEKLILFRCDGTPETGLGHVSRCVALAEALRERGFVCRFFGRLGVGAAGMLSGADMVFDFSAGETGGEKDLECTLQSIRKEYAKGVVIDSYFVNERYVATIDREGVSVLVIDDFNRLERYECAALLNFTVAATDLKYPAGNQLYLLGPEYLLVRQRMRLQRRMAKPQIGEVRRVLVAMGGVDSLNSTCQVVNVFLRIGRDLSVHVIVGRDYAHHKDLSFLVRRFREGSVATQLLDLADEFAWSDLCVCGGGLTKYESAYMGVPTAVLSQNVEQAKETIQFAGKGLAIDLGMTGESSDASLSTWLSELTANRGLRETLSQTGLACFPEDSTTRAAESFVEVINRQG
jgi:UDP-2,4-diacetamido-2,4,6-trideoxy-beta-L-altropyranose hydrolase